MELRANVAAKENELKECIMKAGDRLSHLCQRQRSAFPRSVCIIVHLGDLCLESVSTCTLDRHCATKRPRRQLSNIYIPVSSALRDLISARGQ